MKNWQRLRAQPALLDQFLMREKVIDALRAFFKSQSFHEVETPLLVQSPGTEPYLEVFETVLKYDDGLEKRSFLLTSPEYAMKKLLVAGMGKIFQVCKSFRNKEGRSGRHNPEFTILEWYRADADYTKIMTDCENLLQAIWSSLKGDGEKFQLQYQGKTYNLASPWERISVAEAFQKYCGVDADTLLSEVELKKVARQKGYQVDEATTWEQVYNQLMLNEIEPHLGQTGPTILYDYPASQASLSKKKEADPRFAERFEFFLAGLELGNAFSELTDAAEQERRFKLELEERKQLGKTAYEIDQDYLEALRTGMPPTGGIAVGVDRLVMLFANVSDLADVTFFPAKDIFKLE